MKGNSVQASHIFCIFCPSYAEGQKTNTSRHAMVKRSTIWLFLLTILDDKGLNKKSTDINRNQENQLSDLLHWAPDLVSLSKLAVHEWSREEGHKCDIIREYLLVRCHRLQGGRLWGFTGSLVVSKRVLQTLALTTLSLHFSLVHLLDVNVWKTSVFYWSALFQLHAQNRLQLT